YYTSLAEPDHPENQYEAFRTKLVELFGQKEELIQDSVTRSAEYLIDEHVRYLVRLHADQRQEWEAKLEVPVEGIDATEPAQVEAARHHAEMELEKAKQGGAAAKQQMEKSLFELLENARLTYYSTN
ncbi:hypothetical protein MXD63_41050, partial [Frankia sp. Cpl3]|nr:hypothetical protein [Frankia sp. Cpl3]